MPVVVSVIVGAVLVGWLVMFVWSTMRAARVARLRGPSRTAEAAPEGLVLGIREPEALRAPFAFVLRGQVLDIAQSFTGEFRGEALAVTDLTVRHAPGEDPTNHTVATLEVQWRWPWMRLRRVGVAAPAVEHDPVQLEVLGANDWILEAAQPELACRLVTEELLSWLGRGELPLQLETTPRHLLVAVSGHLADDRLGELVTLATGIVDHVPPDVKADILPPLPQDDH